VAGAPARWSAGRCASSPSPSPCSRCSTTRVVSQPLTAADAASVTAEVGGKSASIWIRGDSREREVEDVVVSPSRVEWTESAAPHARTQAPPGAVERIMIRHHLQGAGEGVLLGLAAGAVVGLVGMQYGDDRAYGFVLGAGIGALGAVILGLGGLIVGHRSNVELPTSPRH
jgi:hypothetical protein